MISIWELKLKTECFLRGETGVLPFSPITPHRKYPPGFATLADGPPSLQRAFFRTPRGPAPSHAPSSRTPDEPPCYCVPGLLAQTVLDNRTFSRARPTHSDTNAGLRQRSPTTCIAD